MQFVTDNRFCGKPSDAMVKGQKKHRGAPFYAGDASTLAHAKVDLEGFEPSSERFDHTLSTRLFQTLVFVHRQDLNHQPIPYPLKLRLRTEAFSRLFPTVLHRYIKEIRKKSP